MQGLLSSWYRHRCDHQRRFGNITSPTLIPIFILLLLLVLLAPSLVFAEDQPVAAEALQTSNTTATLNTPAEVLQAPKDANITRHNDQVFAFQDIVAQQRPPTDELGSAGNDDENGLGVEKDGTDHSLNAFQQLAMEQEGEKQHGYGGNEEDGSGSARKSGGRKRVMNEELVSAGGSDKKERTSRDQLISLAKHKFNQLKLLEAERDKAKLALEVAQHGVLLAKKRVEAFADARESEAEMKRKAEERVNTVKMELPLVDQQLFGVRQELERMTSESELLQTSYHQLMSDYVTLVARLREHPALERWLEHRLGRSLNPLFRAALRKTSSAFVDPLLTGVHSAVHLNSELADEMERHMEKILRRHDGSDGQDRGDAAMPRRMTRDMRLKYRSEFGWGLWFYLILLFPLLIMLSTFRYFFQRIRKFQLTHYTSILAIYLCLMSLACFITSLLTKDDVFIILQIRNPTLNTHTVTYHLIAIFVLIGLLMRTIYESRDIQHISQCIATMGLMSHYYYHVWRPIILDDMSTFGIYAWLLYIGVFGLIGIERMEDSFIHRPYGHGEIPLSVNEDESKMA